MKITLDIFEETYRETLKNTGAKTFQKAAVIAVKEYLRYMKEDRRLRKREAKKSRPLT